MNNNICQNVNFIYEETGFLLKLVPAQVMAGPACH